MGSDTLAAATVPTLDDLLAKILAMAQDLSDNLPGVDPASLYLQITALRGAKLAIA